MVTAMSVLTVACSTNHSHGKVKLGKCKVVPVDAMKSYRGQRRIAPLNLGAR